MRAAEGVIGKIGIVSPRSGAGLGAGGGREGGGSLDDGGKKWERLREDRNLRQRLVLHPHLRRAGRRGDGLGAERRGLEIDRRRQEFNKVSIRTATTMTSIDLKNPMRIIEGNDGGATVSCQRRAGRTGRTSTTSRPPRCTTSSPTTSSRTAFTPRSR